MTRTILVTGPTLADSAVAIAAKRDARVVMMKAYGTEEEIAAEAAKEQADAIIVRAGGRVGGPVYEKSGGVKIVVKHGVGVETIDVAGASQHKVPVMIAVGANALSVAEQALALMFAVAKSLPLSRPPHSGRALGQGDVRLHGTDRAIAWAWSASATSGAP